MASAIKLNNVLGGSLTLKVDDTITTDDVVVINEGFGITSGSNANGSWIKYPDGTMICYHTSTTLLTTSAGSTYSFYSPTSAIFTFPVAFISTPNVTFSTAGVGGTLFPWVGAGDILNTTQCNAWLHSTKNDGTGYISYQAIGRWKS